MRFVLLALILPILVIGCDAVEPYVLTTSIVGTVTDEENGFPLDKTTVNLMMKYRNVGQNIYSFSYINTSPTDENGNYGLTAQIYTGGEYYIEALRNGYNPVYASSLKISVEYKEQQRIDIQLSKK